MKILLIIPTLNRAGAEKVVLTIVNNLVKNTNNQVVLCTLFNEESWLKENFKENLSKQVRLVTLGKKLGFDLKIIFKLFFFIVKEKPNVIHTHLDSINYIFFTRLVSVFSKIKFFHTIHSQSDKEVKSKIMFYIRHFFYKNKLIRPITISSLSNLSFEEHFKMRATMIENCINKVEKSNNYEDVKLYIGDLKKKYDKVFVSIGNLLILKNQIELVKSFEILQKKGYNVCLVLIGGYRKESAVVFETIQTIKPDNVFLLGAKENATDYLFETDAFILPSIYEGLPITLLEALSVGCVPICTKVGGIPNVVTHNKNGYLIDDSSKTEIIKTIETFLKSKINLSEDCKKFFEQRFSIETYIIKHLDLYKQQ